MTGLFEGKVAVVTGAGSGIGAATCRRLAAEGARVIAADIDLPGASAVAAECSGQAVLLDVRRPEEWERVLGEVSATHGHLDIVHLNAGVMTRPTGAPMFDDPVPWLTIGGYEKVVAVNIDGVVYGLLAAIPFLEASGGGDVVVTASISGLMEQPSDPFYAMSKHAVVGLVRGAGPALSSRRIRVNAVCPGAMDTNIVPPDLKASGRMALSPPSYLADAVVTALTSGGTGEIWVAFGAGHEPWRYEHPSPLQ